MKELQTYQGNRDTQIEEIVTGLIFDPIETAGFIREKHSGVLAAILEIGAHLLNAKQNLNHGEYETWVKDHCGLSLRTARFYSKCAKKGYHKRKEIANMRANAFASLMQLPDDIFNLALEEGEIEGRSLEELSKREIENYYEKIKADRDIERRRRIESEDRIREGEKELSEADEKIEELKKEIENFKDPEYFLGINTEEANRLISEAVLLLLKLSNIKVPVGRGREILSPLIVAVKSLQDKWGNKWED